MTQHVSMRLLKINPAKYYQFFKCYKVQLFSLETVLTVEWRNIKGKSPQPLSHLYLNLKYFKYAPVALMVKQTSIRSFKQRFDILS